MANLEIFDLALLLLGAKIGGIIFHKLRQPSLAGELLAGMVSISEMSLIILSIGLAAGAIGVSLYSTMILVFLFVNIISPFITSMAFRDGYDRSYGRKTFKLTAMKKFGR